MQVSVRLLTLAAASTLSLPALAQCVSPSSSQFSTLYQGTTYLGSPDPTYGANMLFDLDCSVDITITGLAMNLLDDGIGTNPILVGETADVVIWTFPITWVGNNTVGTGNTVPATPPGWTQVGDGIVTVAARNTPSVVVLSAPFTLAAGTYGVAVQHLPTIPSLMFPNPEVIHPLYTNPAVAVGTPLVWTDQFVMLTAGAGQGTAFTSGVAQPRVFNCDIDYSVGPNTAFTTTYGASCYDRPQSFYEEFPAPGTTDLVSLDWINLGPNYVVSATATAMMPFNQTGAIHVNAAAPGLSGTAGSWDDANSVPISLPASWSAGFPYPTGSTTAIEINSNGVVWLQPSTTTAGFYGGVNNVLASVASIVGCYGDWEPTDVLNPATGAGDIYVDVGAGDSYVAITWDQVAEWNQVGSSNTFQIVLYQNGNVTVTHSSVAMVAAEMMCGFSPGNGAPDPGAVDLSVVANPAFVTGDGASAAVLSIDARPVGGTTVNLVTSNLQASVVLSATVASLGSLPGFDLTSLGLAAPGCSAWVDPAGAVQLGLTLGGPTSSIPFTVPVGYSGFQIFTQSLQLDPSANAVGITTTNGICLALGSQ